MSDPHTDYATLSGDWEGYGPESADEPFGTPPVRPCPTEAEYAATLPERTDRVVAEVNERLADVLPDGVRFEFEPQPPMDLAAVAAVMRGMPRLTRRTLHCHPTVTGALKMVTAPAKPRPSFMDPGRIGDLCGIDVFENDEMTPGAWEIREGEKVVNFGVLRDA